MRKDVAPSPAENGTSTNAKAASSILASSVGAASSGTAPWINPDRERTLAERESPDPIVRYMGMQKDTKHVEKLARRLRKTEHDVAFLCSLRLANESTGNGDIAGFVAAGTIPVSSLPLSIENYSILCLLLC